MDSYDTVRIIGISLALVLAVANFKSREIELSDGLRMAALWAFLFIVFALVFSVLGW